MLQHLLVRFERALVVLLLVEAVLGDGHPGVGGEARTRKALDDDLEVLDRLAELALVAQRERVEIDDRVDLAEARVLLDQAVVDRLRARQIDGRRPARHVRAGAAVLVAGGDRGLIALHLVEVGRLRLFPVELGQLVERLGLLVAARAVAQVVLEQPDPLAPRLGDLFLLDADRLLQHRRQRVLVGGAVVLGRVLLVASVLACVVAGALLDGRLGRGSPRRSHSRERRDRAAGDQDLVMNASHL